MLTPNQSIKGINKLWLQNSYHAETKVLIHHIHSIRCPTSLTTMSLTRSGLRISRLSNIVQQKNNQKWFLNRLEVSQHVCCLFMRQACSTYFNAASIDVVNQSSDCQSRHAVQLNPLLATFTQSAVKHGAEVRWARGQHCAVAQNFSVASHKHCVCTAHLNRMYFPESTARSLLYYYYTHLTAPFQKNLEPDLQNILQFSVRLS